MELKISAIGDEVADTLSKQIQILKKNNLTNIEIRNIEQKNIIEHDIKDIQNMYRMLEKNNIHVTALDTKIGKKKCYMSKEIYKTLTQYIKIATILQCKYIRLFSDISKDANVDRDLWAKVFEMAQKNQITLLIENEGNTYVNSLHNCLNFFDELSTLQLKLLFDIGNCYKNGENIFKFYESMHASIEYIHLKDIIKDQNGKFKCVPLGYGDIELKSFFEKLNSSCYNGVLSLEPHFYWTQDGLKKERMFELSCERLRCLIKNFNN